MKQPYLIVLDTETGGYEELLNPITEIALEVLESEKFKSVAKYQTFIQKYKDLTYEIKAIQATQVDMAKVAKGKTFDKVVKELIEIFQTYETGGKASIKPTLVCHNAEFDLKFMKQLFIFANKNLFDYIEVVPIDTMRLMQFKEANKKAKDGEVSRMTLTACCERMGIKLVSAHGAEADVSATVKLVTLLLKSMREEKKVEKNISPEETVKSRKFFEF